MSKILKERPLGFIFECPDKHKKVRAHVADIEGLTLLCRVCGRTMRPLHSVQHAATLEQATQRLEAVAVAD